MYLSFTVVGHTVNQSDFYWFFENQEWGWISYFFGDIFPKLY